MDALRGNDSEAEYYVVEKPFSGIEELYLAHFHALTVQLYGYTGDLGVAQELVQEAFCRAIPEMGQIIPVRRSARLDPQGGVQPRH